MCTPFFLSAQAGERIFPRSCAFLFLCSLLNGTLRTLIKRVVHGEIVCRVE